jgi:hypothetical protein
VEEIEALWTDLASADAARGYRALCQLAAVPRQAAALVKQRMRPAPTSDPRRLARLIHDLDDDRFTIREQATAELAALGEAAVPTLQEARKRQPSPEAARRLRQLLEHCEEEIPPPEQLRQLRSVELLEGIGTSEARELLAKLASGTMATRLSREARASLNRLERRLAAGP